MLSSSDNKEIFLGIDGGGSKCKAIVMSGDNKILGTGIAGPANPLHGYEQAINSIELQENDIILITGSLYLAGEVLNLN